MQFQVHGSLALRLHTIASAEGRDIDDVLHEAILEYLKRWETEHHRDFDELVERLMKENAWLLEQLGKGPE